MRVGRSIEKEGVMEPTMVRPLDDRSDFRCLVVVVLESGRRRMVFLRSKFPLTNYAVGQIYHRDPSGSLFSDED